MVISSNTNLSQVLYNTKITKNFTSIDVITPWRGLVKNPNIYTLLLRNCLLANLGQLVLADIYNCNAIYTLQNIDRMYDNNFEPKLTLIQKVLGKVAFLQKSE